MRRAQRRYFDLQVPAPQIRRIEAPVKGGLPSDFRVGLIHGTGRGVHYAGGDVQLSRGRPGRDKDGDGHSNWLEFAFGAAPNSANGALVGVKTEGDVVTFEFLRRQSGVNYEILHTTDLGVEFRVASGLELTVSESREEVPEGWERVELTVPGQGAGFYRIGASSD